METWKILDLQSLEDLSPYMVLQPKVCSQDQKSKDKILVHNLQEIQLQQHLPLGGFEL